MKDTTNLQNIKMAVVYVVVFILALVIIFGCSIVFGMQTYSKVSGFYDKPQSSICFHDHRL